MTKYLTFSVIEIRSATLAPTDADGDGDIDMYVGNYNGYILYYKNIGTKKKPVYEKTDSENPFDAMTRVGFNANIRLFDIDQDGDEDMFVGCYQRGTITFYKNTGNSTSPVYELTTGSDNPFDGVIVDGGRSASLEPFDMNNDGKMDFLIGNYIGTIQYFEQVGNDVHAPVFEEKKGDANPFQNMDCGDRSNPKAVDWDNDGDLDVFVGGNQDLIYYFENTGSVMNPVFTLRTGLNDPFNNLDVVRQTVWERYLQVAGTHMAIFDVDDDGDLDMVG